MKIDGNRLTNDPAVQQADATRTVKSGKAGGSAAAGTGSGDRVEVSAEGQFVTSALKAADSAPAIRHEKVAAARQALAEGRVGRDTVKLADKMIDHMLGKQG